MRSIHVIPHAACATVVQIQILDWPANFPDTIGKTYPRLLGHHAKWLHGIASGFGHRALLIKASENNRSTGFLPLVLVSGPFFGKFLISLPYINTGGVCAENQQTAHALIDKACDLADNLNVRYLELRHELAVPHPRLTYQRTDKVHMRLALPEDTSELNNSFKSKLRSQIKKASQYNLSISWGGENLLQDFYQVFSHNMRDLGTPVFSRQLFRSLLSALQPAIELCVVRQGERPIATAMLVHLAGVTEVPSASSLRAYNHTNANMWMYHNLLNRAIEKHSHTFDFGRSSVNSGTYKFKAQWGARPHPAIWQYYLRKGDVNALRPDAPRNQRLIRIWQQLPVWLTKIAGPVIVRGIP